MKTAATLFYSIILGAALTGDGEAQSIIERSSFEWNNISLRASFDSLLQRYRESIVYLDKDVEGKNVSVSCSNCSCDQALNFLLSGTSLTWIKRGNQFIITKQDTEHVSRYCTLSGTVTDSVTGEWIAGATVLLQDSAGQIYKTVRRWCPTNTFGFFSLPRVPIGRFTLVIRAMGYETVEQDIETEAEKHFQCSLGMIQKNISVREVIIEGQRTALLSTSSLLHSTYHRSVPTDQNQYMLDGGRIYNPAHYGGVLSTFNPEALNDVQVALGGLPPVYGGRVGGIVDLSMREGSRRQLSGSCGVGTLGSNLSLEGPISGTTTFLVSGRRGYPDAAMKIVPPDGLKPSLIGSSELIAKITQRLSGSDQISLSGYVGKDTYNNEGEGEEQVLKNDFSWGNKMFDLRWIGIVTPSLFLHTSVGYSRYYFMLHHDIFSNVSLSSSRVSSNYAIEDFSIDAHAENYYDEDHTIRAGVELIHHRIDGSINRFSSQTAPLSLRNLSLWEAAVYLQDQWKILPGIAAELGGRATSFTSTQGSFSAIDPRFSLLLSFDEQTRFYTSFSAINQFIHPYRQSGVFLISPAIFWYPSSEKAKPSTSLHVTLGMERSWDDDAYSISAELYYRITNNLHGFGLDSIPAQTEDLEKIVLLGTGRMYGFTCSVRKRTGDVTGILTYNFSWSGETFAQIYGGNEFQPPFDRRHELQGAVSYAAGENWIMSALCVIISKHSSTITPNVIQSEDEKRRGEPTLTSAYEKTMNTNGFVDINGSKLPGFQRFELDVTRRFSLLNVSCEFSLRFMNSYGLLDPFIWKLKNTKDGLKWSAALREQNLFPLYPAVDIMVRF
jgi:hypothetical protein